MKKFLGLFLTFLICLSSVSAQDLRFVQISDARFSETSGSNMLDEVIKDINKQNNVEFVIFTGDNINRPVKSDLELFLSKAKKLKCPFYIVIGDHDVNKYKDLSKLEYIKTIKHHIRKYKPETPNYVFEKNGVIFVVADGSKDVIPGTSGFFKDDVLIWLDEQLGIYNDKNVIIFQHFPIIPPSNKETYYTAKPETYLKVLNKHKNVRAIISGHFDVNKEQTVQGVTHISTSGLPYYRIIDILDCETQNPTIWTVLKEIK